MDLCGACQMRARVASVAFQHEALRSALDALADVPHELSDVVSRIKSLQARIKASRIRIAEKAQLAQLAHASSAQLNHPGDSLPAAPKAQIPRRDRWRLALRGKRGTQHESQPRQRRVLILSTISAILTRAIRSTFAPTETRSNSRSRTSCHSQRSRNSSANWTFNFDRFVFCSCGCSVEMDLTTNPPQFDRLHRAVSQQERLLSDLFDLYAFVFDGPTSGWSCLCLRQMSSVLTRRVEEPEDDRLELNLRFAEIDASHLAKQQTTSKKTLAAIDGALDLRGSFDHTLAKIRDLTVFSDLGGGRVFLRPSRSLAHFGVQWCGIHRKYDMLVSAPRFILEQVG